MAEEEGAVEDLLPKRPVIEWERKRVFNATSCTKKELEDAMEGMKTGKAPGPDGIMIEAARLAVKVQPDFVFSVMNDLLKKGIFPDP